MADAAPKLRKARPRPVPVVTIAAGPSEIARLKTLATVMQKPRLKIVEAKQGATADFTVTTAADGQGGARLFSEQLHIVAGPKIATLADLRGKVVSLGAEHSASQAAARKALDAQGIKVAETPLDPDNALDGLSTGDLDAVVLLAPQPDARLAKLKGTSLHLVAWPQTATPPDGMTASTIDAAAYPGLAGAGGKVAALGVDAVLAPGPKARTQQAKAFLGALSQHSAALSRRGFDLIRADLEQRGGRRVANAEAR
ncbi:MAG: hypothetical protein INR64_19650 [Caulobacteraceae bacterium]|nr:hypothetical protein [Caulobacter sp.]